MRIVGGEWRGRKLAALDAGDLAAQLRPTADRFRETVFNILNTEKYGFAPKDCHVLDLFAGTGALGLEALSRGARQAVFVDNGKKAQSLIRENIGILNAKPRAHLLKADALALGNAEMPFDLVFLDPPYGRGFGEKALESAQKGGWLKQNSVIIWEEELAPLMPNFLERVDQRKIGRGILTISIYRG